MKASVLYSGCTQFYEEQHSKVCTNLFKVHCVEFSNIYWSESILQAMLTLISVFSVSLVEQIHLLCYCSCNIATSNSHSKIPKKVLLNVTCANSLSYHSHKTHKMLSNTTYVTPLKQFPTSGRKVHYTPVYKKDLHFVSPPSSVQACGICSTLQLLVHTGRRRQRSCAGPGCHL